MMKSFSKSHLAIKAAGLAMIAMVTGCAVWPDFKRPDAPRTTGYAPTRSPHPNLLPWREGANERLSESQTLATASAPVLAGESQRFNSKLDIPYDWWTLFGSERIDSLVERAFKSNPDITSAEAALRQAQFNVVAQQGFFYPTVGINYTPSRNKLAGNMGGNSPGVQGNGNVIQTGSNPAGPVYNSPAYYNFHVAQLTVGYVPDVFGLNRRTVESAQTQVETQKLQLHATYITLASNVVAAAIQEASLRSQIAAMEKVVNINRQLLEVLQTQYKLGDVSNVDVEAQRSALAAVEQNLPPLNAQLEQTRDLLRALAGNTPDVEVDGRFELSDIHLPQELPLSLPSRIVEQRPDVRAAEEQLHFASAQAGVAVANRLPQFALTAAVGGMADSPAWMFRSGGGFFNLAASVSQTLFDGGTLKARSQAAEQALIVAGAQYRSTVIAALQNVADTLYTIQSNASVLKAAAKGAQAAKTSAELARKQCQLGAVNYQTQLTAEQNDQLSKINLTQAEASRLGVTVALYQALGGGWWNHPDRLK